MYFPYPEYISQKDPPARKQVPLIVPDAAVIWGPVREHGRALSALAGAALAAPMRAAAAPTPASLVAIDLNMFVVRSGCEWCRAQIFPPSRGDAKLPQG